MASPNVHPIDDINFETEVLGSSTPFLLDVTATWCGPCKALGHIVDRLADGNVGRFRVGKMDLDEARVTATRLGVRAAPTVIAFSDGKEIGRRVGLTTADKLLALLQPG
jgi:thioredoxin 1